MRDARVRLIHGACYLLILLATLPASAAEKLADKLLPLIKAHEGKVAVAVKHLKTGETFAHNADEPMPTASLIKLPVMVEAYRQAEAGKVDLQKMITLRPEDKVPGSGILTQHFSAGMTLPLVDAIHLMIVYSDNTATNLVVDQIGLPATTAAMEQFELPHTKLHSKVFKGTTTIAPERSKQFGLGSTTANEMVQLLEMLDAGKLASPENTKAMQKHLAECEGKRLSRDLPSEIRVQQKTGSVNAVRTVAGVLELPSGNVAVCVLTNENQDRSWLPTNAGEVIASKIGRVVFDHFEPDWKPAAQRKSLVLKLGAQGVRVEKLQQALNKELAAKGAADQQLTVDGDFGMQTRAAVVQWQNATKQPETGELDLEAWKKLGLSESDFQAAK
ncbi:serine hydrolase [Anatilimnocola sp. NA78]|uniref:serine hydrolase n=1 Tax=Anatilimnocola sp. NA78 TaxID=3415683 RepID=UPI003CE59043